MKFQGGLTNAELTAAFKRKLPDTQPTDRDLAVFALGIEVGDSLQSERRDTTEAEDAARYRWFKANSRKAEMFGVGSFWTTKFTLDGKLDFDAAIDAAMAATHDGAKP